MTEMLDLRELSRQCMPEVPAKEHLRDAAIRTWTGRMVNEHGSSRVFEGLHRQFSALGLPERDLNRLKDFAAEEKNHGVLCGAVVEALGGEARAPAIPVIPFPEHPDATPLEGALRNLLSISCLSETIAVALIGAERLEMPEGPLNTLLTKIYAEECGHANFGWRLLGDLLKSGDQSPDAPFKLTEGCDSVSEGTKDLRARLSDYLIVAFAHLESHEMKHLPLDSNPPPEGAELGLCSGASARKLFYATVEGIIIPGLESHGLAARSAWERRKEVHFD